MENLRKTYNNLGKPTKTYGQPMENVQQVRNTCKNLRKTNSKENVQKPKNTYDFL